MSGVGHRLLLVHLFLPDTLAFHPWDEDSDAAGHVATLGEGGGGGGQIVVDSPADSSRAEDALNTPPAATHHLPLHELSDRLAKANLRSSVQSSGPTSLDVPQRNSASKSAPESREHVSVASVRARDHALEDDSAVDIDDEDSGPEIGAARVQRTTRSARGSFSADANARKITMTSLISEGSGQGGSSTLESQPIRVPSPANASAATRSRRNSPSGALRPNIAALTDTRGANADGTDIPVAAASDHGRGVASTSPGTQLSSSSLSAATPLSRSAGSGSHVGGRDNKGGFTQGGSPFGPRGIAPGALGLTVPGESDSRSGTKTPGAKAGGKAGTLTPLSIIGDLAAKQTSMHALSTPGPQTPGDKERHHPFGSGAVTPRHGSQTPGHSVRTPGFPPNAKGHSQGALSRPPMNLSMSAMKVPQARAEGMSGAATGGASTPHHHSSLGLTGLGGAKKPSGAQSAATAGVGTVSSALAGGTINDHGRGVVAETSPPGPIARPHSKSNEDNKAISGISALGTPHDRSGRGSDRRINAGSAIGAGSPNAVAEKARQTHGGIMPPSSSFNRMSSKNRAPGPRCGSRRNPSSTGRSVGRRASVASMTDAGGESIISASSTPARIPRFDFEPNPSANGGLVNAVDSVSRDRLRAGKVYVGAPGISIDDWAGPIERALIADRLRNERSSTPVWLEDDLMQGHYTHFCKQILWPTFHYTLPSQRGLEQEHEAFVCYREVNRRFADAIVAEYREGDIIWVNDYHLLLVPQMVRERLPYATIGLFLHIAFPSSEIFRCLSVREELLRGMLGADLIGFQTHNFCRHFRQTVSRILQLEATPKGIQMDSSRGGGFVTVSAFPIGIDVRNLNRKRADPEVGEWVAKLRERYDGKRVIVARDKLDWIKGVRQKLLAFEVFLDEHPEWVGKVVLIQIALATTEDNDEIGASSEVVSRVNNKHSSLAYQPVVFLHVQDMTFSQYLALLTIADAFLASSLREGMNLTSHEYVVCQEEKHSPLILSEFTGTYSALRACIGINPWNTKQVAHAIHKAVTMSAEEASARWEDLHRCVLTQTSQHWLTSLLSRLERAHLETQRRQSSFIPRLEVASLISEWRAARKRLLLIDLEDTLMPAPERDFPKEPEEALIKLLKDLCADTKNRVYLLSGRGTSDLESFAKDLPAIGLIAENGCAVSYVGNTSHSQDEASPGGSGARQWVSLVAGYNLSWMAPVREILSYFSERTEGSYMEERGASILWRFWSRSAGDPHSHQAQWARKQSAELQNLVYDSLGERFSLRIIPGSTSFLIMPKGVSRASAVQHIISLSQMGASAATPASPASPVVNPFGMGRHVRNPAVESIKGGGPARDSSPYKLPSNAFMPMFQSQREHDLGPSRHNGPAGGGSFDFAFALGQDDALLAYVSTLDMLFAPITCTSSADMRGSEASFYVRGQGEARAALRELVQSRVRDAVWGRPAMSDI
ncbi:hypothetical protein IE81DRAFT_323008 [Ceraceosorus guamensis]|uniref:Uncharacterized protein n=1 Tax=Ceraceosorus guamensis TaxID=1522189 RepID=A0A316VZK1_9BASI|nr:hypothetical protein IE81DRAFT_323008 [Ceraceosorus guamensis]PWN42869.1 hypothetical protein IE81DRAFT_323008 [Ceraceosorus guamensis]